MANLKRFFTVFFFVIIYIYLFGDDKVWDDRNSKEGALAAYNYYKSEYKTKKDFESSWKLARAVQFYASYFPLGKDTKTQLFIEGKDAAYNAIKLEPEKPEGWLFYIICLGGWAEMDGGVGALSALSDAESAATKLISISPSFMDGAPYLLRARLYDKSPKVISIGDEKKAEADYKKAMTYPNVNRSGLRFYAEFLIDRNRIAEAKVYIERFFKKPYDAKDKVFEDTEIQLMNELVKKIVE